MFRPGSGRDPTERGDSVRGFTTVCARLWTNIQRILGRVRRPRPLHRIAASVKLACWHPYMTSSRRVLVWRVVTHYLLSTCLSRFQLFSYLCTRYYGTEYLIGTLNTL